MQPGAKAESEPSVPGDNEGEAARPAEPRQSGGERCPVCHAVVTQDHRRPAGATRARTGKPCRSGQGVAAAGGVGHKEKVRQPSGTAA